jgi:hypothetical protein
VGASWRKRASMHLPVLLGIDRGKHRHHRFGRNGSKQPVTIP